MHDMYIIIHVNMYIYIYIIISYLFKIYHYKGFLKIYKDNLVE